MELKKTGVVRRIDDLGRVVIPKEFRKQMRIMEGDPLELCICEGEGQLGVLFVPYSPLTYNFPQKRILRAMYDGMPNKDALIALVDNGSEYLGPCEEHEYQAETVRKEGYAMFRKIQGNSKPETFELENDNKIFAVPLINGYHDEVVAILLVCGATASVKDNEAYILAQAEILNSFI